MGLGSSATGSWQKDLFDCFSDVTFCMLSWFLPCYMFGLIAKAVGEDCLLYGILSAIPFINLYFCTKVRTDVRTERKIDGTVLNDFLVTTFCTPCALTQEAQEMQVNIEAEVLLRK